MILKSFTLNRIMVLIVSSGFLFLFIETLLEHLDALPRERAAFIPIIASLIGFIISLIAVQGWKERLIHLLQYYLIIMIFVGLGGLFFHNEPRFEPENHETEITSEKKVEPEVEAPILAPASFIGLALVGLTATGRKRQCEIRQKA